MSKKNKTYKSSKRIYRARKKIKQKKSSTRIY